MEVVAAALPFMKVIGAFVLMLVGIRHRLGLSLSILLGGAFMGLVFGLSIGDWLRISATALVQEKFLLLIAIVGASLVLSDGLERSGQSTRLMTALSGYLVRPRLRLDSDHPSAVVSQHPGGKRTGVDPGEVDHPDPL